MAQPALTGIQKAQSVGGNAYGQKPSMPNQSKNPPMPVQAQRPLGSFKKGGHVKKTGMYRLHKGEHVVNSEKHKNKAIKKALEKNKK